MFYENENEAHSKFMPTSLVRKQRLLKIDKQEREEERYEEREEEREEVYFRLAIVHLEPKHA